MKKLKRVLIWLTLLSFSSIMFTVLFVLYKEIKHMPTQVEMNKGFDIFKPLLGHYYINYSKRKYLRKDFYIFDKNGIPIFIVNGGYHYHPVYISQFALGAYDYYLNTKNNDARNDFIKCANWLKDNLKKHGRFFYWEYTFNIDFPGGIYRVPWFSAMAQGVGTSVLLRAFYETKDKTYLQAAKKAIKPIFYDISAGGISIVKDNYYIFPQEYPTDPPSDILNGAIFTYFGLYDYYRVTGDPYTKKKSDIVAKTLSNLLDYYDTGYWSLYSRWPQFLATPHYNSVHITQLRILYLITGNERFLRYSQKFEIYQNNWIYRTRYVLANHLRQAKEFSFNDIKKIPEFLEKVLGS